MSSRLHVEAGQLVDRRTDQIISINGCVDINNLVPFERRGAWFTDSTTAVRMCTSLNMGFWIQELKG
jgi:hypothetical protein